ncbi:hypothetical protein FA13DRAFT_24527 [Coprinellus micaceus]|uniref:Uncharacterized protein n=1 Tax=Coprinellus micaceus TaxID=71717 RepID=A0A4Y7U016_COPMI|nr:hypothetical protein FA13DRAFT_24527 [Coprinellus micaceus]
MASFCTSSSTSSRTCLLFFLTLDAEALEEDEALALELDPSTRFLTVLRGFFLAVTNIRAQLFRRPDQRTNARLLAAPFLDLRSTRCSYILFPLLILLPPLPILLLMHGFVKALYAEGCNRPP